LPLVSPSGFSLHGFTLSSTSASFFQHPWSVFGSFLLWTFLSGASLSSFPFIVFPLPPCRQHICFFFSSPVPLQFQILRLSPRVLLLLAHLHFFLFFVLYFRAPFFLASLHPPIPFFSLPPSLSFSFAAVRPPLSTFFYPHFPSYVHLSLFFLENTMALSHAVNFWLVSVLWCLAPPI